MKNSRNKKSHEKTINRTYVDEVLDADVLSLLGMFNTPIGKLANRFDKKEKLKIPDEHVTNFDADDLAQLPPLKLNIELSEADTDWVLKEDGNFGFFEDDEDDYIERIQKAVDAIYPCNKNTDKDKDKDLIPITILLPNVNPFDIEGLEGEELEFSNNEYEKLDGSYSYSYWQFITLKNESDGDKLGFQDLAENPDSFYGLRLFLALKLLGIVKTNQGGKNLSRIFYELINSTPLNEHFTLLSSKKIQEYNKLHKEIEVLKRKLKKLKNTNEIKDCNDLITEKSNEIGEMYLFSTAADIKSGCYYSLLIDNLSKLNSKKFDLDPDEDFVFPTLDSSLNSPIFSTNKLDLDKGKPSPRIMRRMRFMLSYLFPMTCGTAITIYIKKESDDQLISSPLLLLPQSWNDLAAALKKHNPKEELPDYDDEDELEFREACIRDIHAKLWGKKTKFMRATVPITGTSEVDVLKAQK